MLDVTEEDNDAMFVAKLCPVLMNNINWTPFRPYIVTSDYIRQMNDILFYFMPPERNVFERDLRALLSDPVLPCDLDYALPRLQRANFYPEVKILDVLSRRDRFNLLLIPGKRILWRRNSMDIFINGYVSKESDGIRIMGLNAIAADYVNAFTADKVHSPRFAARVTPPVKFSNLDRDDLSDKELILSRENVAHFIIENQ
jgi:hypothetical protein